MREVTAATSSLRANFHSPFRRLWHIFDRPEMVVVESRRRERERRREEEEGGGVSGESTHDFYLNRYCHRDRVLNVRPLMNLEIRFRNWIKTRWHARCSEQRRDTKGREGQMERGKRLPPMFWQWNFGQKLPLVSRLRIPRQCLGSPSVLASLSCLIGTYIWSEESPLYYHQSKYFSFLLSFSFVEFIVKFYFHFSSIFDNLISISRFCRHVFQLVSRYVRNEVSIKLMHEEKKSQGAEIFDILFVLEID